MIRLTLKDALPEIARIAGITGFRVNDVRSIARLNSATAELVDDGDWPGVVDRYKFAIYGGTITLPGDFNRIIAVCADGNPIEMRSPWYEFCQDGPGPLDSEGWTDVLLDRGESCTVQPIPIDGTIYKLRVYGRVDERTGGVRPKIIFRGWDSNGEWVRTQVDGVWQDGVEVEINGDTGPKWIESPISFSALESVIKPITNGYVYVQATNGAVTYHLASYAPKETNPSYRQYFIPSLSSGDTHQVIARVRKRFVPVRNENDLLMITNINALGAMLKAQQKSDADDVAGYWNFKKIASSLMKKEAEAYRGKTIKQAVTMSAGFSMGSVPHVQ